MKHLLVMVMLLLLIAGVAHTGMCEGRFESAELETGAVWQSMNDVRIPNTGAATKFSLSRLVGNGPWPAARLYVTYTVAPKHQLRLLAAPLTIDEHGSLDTTVRFAGGTFVPGPAAAKYTFNSYRLTYRYQFFDKRWKLHVGFSAKVRDAVIRLTQDNRSAEKTDLGFVPLLHLAGRYSVTPQSGFMFDLDALAGGPGRAEDLALKYYYEPNDRWRIAAGYRTVEGGADVDEVYTFAWLHYAVLSAMYKF